MARRGTTKRQELYLVFGGELTDPTSNRFADTAKLEAVGIYASYRQAVEAWRGAAQRTVDNALMRYFVVPLDQLLSPAKRGKTRV
ncbi:MAG: DUF4170 domain-containing protein [Alphaproteobacteria bacterium]|nr:DUF4170 domain-containing protein [Alphaproteobacteria bacterium]